MRKKICVTICFFCLLLVLPAPLLSVLSGKAVHGTAAVSAASKTYKNTLRKKNGKLYYYNAKGKIVKNCWKTINGKRYHFGKTGAADTGFKTIRKKRYCFSSAGVMRTGWYTKGKKTYYFHKTTGVMYTGWKKIDGKTYYFKSSGVMAKSAWVNSRYLGKDGVYDSSKKLPMANLQSKLKKAIKSFSGTWSVYVKNLDTNESFSINNRSMYAASLIKLYAMGAAYEKVSQGKLKASSVNSLLKSMITVSSNDAFNSIVKKVGISYVNQWCKANGYTQTNEGHGLSPSSNNYGLSNGSGSNMTSVKDCGKFLESVYRGTCVNAKYSKKMLSLLKQQTRRTKIPAGVPSSVTVANKTGETDDYTHDAAIVYSKGATYIICVMGKAPGYAWSAASNITRLSRIVYNYFN